MRSFEGGLACGVLLFAGTFSGYAFDIAPYRIIDPVDGQRYVIFATGRPTSCDFSLESAEERILIPSASRNIHQIPIHDHFFSRTNRGAWLVRCRNRHQAFQSRPLTFRASTHETFRAVFLTDTQSDPRSIDPILPLIREFGPDVYLHGGDVVQESDNRDQWKEFFRVYGGLFRDSPILASFGDHEFKPDRGRIKNFAWNYDQFIGNQTVNEGRWPGVFLSPKAHREKRFYGVVRFGPFEVYVLDSNLAAHSNGKTTIEPSSIRYAMDQKAWLENELRRSSQDPTVRFRLALFHWPPFGSNDLVTSLLPFDFSLSEAESWSQAGGHVLNLSVLWFYFWQWDLNPKVNVTSDDYLFLHLTPLFEKYNVQLVLNGHLHRYERSELHGVQYITGGAAGGFMNRSPQNYVNALLPRDYQKLSDELERERTDLTEDQRKTYGDVRVTKAPTLERTVTFLEGDDRLLSVWTCAYREKRFWLLDQVDIPSNGSIQQVQRRTFVDRCSVTNLHKNI